MSFKVIVISMFLCFSSINAWDIEPVYFKAEEGLKLHHSDQGFFISKDNDELWFDVKYYNIDKELRGISTEKLMFLLGKKKLISIDGQSFSISTMTNRECSENINKGQFIHYLQNLTSEEELELKQLIAPTGRLIVTQSENGEFIIKHTSFLLGGGAGGAIVGAWVGKFVASAVCHGSIYLVGAAVSTVATPAAGAIVIASLETTLATPIETITTTAALAAGISGAVASGPA